MVPFILIGCNKKKEEPITDKEESTIIKNATSTDEYLNKKDYKSIAYAYIYHIKEGLQSYESETNGTVKAKIAFINYDIKYNSVTYKNGKTFYSKDYSTSTLMNVKNEFYMVDKDKILVSRDYKNYKVFTTEDYHKISYTPDQYTIMGYVFNDQSIIKTEVLSDKGDTVSIRYTLDNELATNIVKVDLKNSGSLSSYPVFHNIEITLSMKRDFTPISYAINAEYDASKPVIGSARTTQQGECIFSKVNERITVPNEAFLMEQIGAQPSEIIIDEGEQTVKDELMAAVKKLDFEHGVNVNGNLTLDLMNTPLVLNIDSNLIFDINRLSGDKIYEILSFYAKLEADENFGTLVSLIKTFAGDKLGEYAAILDGFKSLEAVYDGDGAIYLMPVNKEDIRTTVLKIKLVDILDLVLKQVNVYNLVNGANNDLVSFKKIEGKDANNYEVEITLNPDTVTSIKEGIDKFFANPDYALIKTLLGYKDFDSIKAKVGVVNGVVHTLDASFNYIQSGDPDVVKTFVALHLEANNQTYDFAKAINDAKALYDLYTSTLELKARMSELSKNVYVSKTYLANIDKAIDEYNQLNDQQKDFVGRNLLTALENAKKEVSNIITFLNALAKYDLNNLNNQTILELLKLYSANSLNTTLLQQEMTESDYQKIINLGDYVDYSIFDNAVSKIVGSDETTWNLNEQEIRGIKLICDIAAYSSAAKTHMWLELLKSGNTIDIDVFITTINNLYNGLTNN